MHNFPFLSKPRLLAAIVAILAGWPASQALSDSKYHRPPIHRQLHRQLHGPQGILTRSRYRPKIKILSIQKSGKITKITHEIYTRSGYIDRVEARVNGKAVATVRFPKPMARATATIRIDFSKAGPGKHSLRLWGWQGRQGYQSVHGESKKITFTNP